MSLTKPCACGNPEHTVVQRPGEEPYNYHRRRFATRECWKSPNDANSGALIASLDWLTNAPPGRIIAQRQAQGLIP